MAEGSIHKRELPGGRVRWDAYIDLPRGDDGKRRTEKKTFQTRREAQSYLTARRAEIASGTVVERSARTVEELMAFWLDNYARHKVSKKTYEGYAATIRRHIVPALGPIPLQKLTPARLQSFYSEKIDAGCGTRTLRLCHIHISAALKEAVKLGWVPRNVADATTPPRWKAREMDVWTLEEARGFLRVADESVYGPLWRLALGTGMRKGELLGLRWRDIDFERKTLWVRQTVGTLGGKVVIKPGAKNDSSIRQVHAPDDVLVALREHRQGQLERRLESGALWRDHDLVFCTRFGTAHHPDNMDLDIDRLIKKAGVKRIRIHDLRHTYATIALQLGVPIKVVSENLGHADVATTLRTYAHVLPSQREELAAKMGSALFGPSTEAV